MHVTLKCGAIIDLEDAPIVAAKTGWCVPSSGGWKGYAVSTMGSGRLKQTIALHRLVMHAGPGELIDHRNGDTLDCRKENLRRSDKAGNAHNMRRSKNQKKGRFKGVFAAATVSERWRAQIGITEKGKLRQLYLGCFSTQEEAARAYDKKALELFGEFAALNFEQEDT